MPRPRSGSLFEAQLFSVDIRSQMKSQLQSLFQAINQSANEDELRSQVAPKIGEYFAATRSGIFFFDQLFSADRNLNPALKKTIQVALSTERNPVTRYLTEQHAPVHESLVTSHKSWRMICPRSDHWHVMVGPIVSSGQLIGALGCTRERSCSAFNDQHLADIGAICLHLSVWAATTRSQTSSESFADISIETVSISSRLTARELQIAKLVALGKKNAEVGAELYITENSVKQALKKIFRKLEVSSRTQMARQLLASEKQSH